MQFWEYFHERVFVRQTTSPFLSLMDAKEKDMQSTKGRKLCVKWSLHSFGNSFSNSQQLKRWLVIFFHAIDADVRVCFSFWFKMRPLFQWVLYLNSEKFKKQKQRIQVRKKLKYFSVFISFSMGCVVLFNKPLLILSCHQSISLYSRMKCISLEGKHFVSVCVLHFRVLSASYR